jgi:mono/diheme cytochrome c family protein
MRYLQFKQVVAGMALAASLGCVAALAQTSRYSSMGTTPTPEDLGNVAWASGASGKDLPSGKGTAKQGAQIFLVKCSMCHGPNAEGVKGTPGAFSPYMGSRLGGGNGVPLFKPPAGRITTIAYTVPWATVIFNTIAVEMPFYRPGTLTSDEVYALTAFVLFKNSIIKEDEVMDRDTLPKVQMPNRNNFPASDEVYMDMKKRGCIQTYGECRDP